MGSWRQFVSVCLEFVYGDTGNKAPVITRSLGFRVACNLTKSLHFPDVERA